MKNILCLLLLSFLLFSCSHLKVVVNDPEQSRRCSCCCLFSYSSSGSKKEKPDGEEKKEIESILNGEKNKNIKK